MPTQHHQILSGIRATPTVSGTGFVYLEKASIFQKPNRGAVFHKAFGDSAEARTLVQDATPIIPICNTAEENVRNI